MKISTLVLAGSSLAAGLPLAAAAHAQDNTPPAAPCPAEGDTRLVSGILAVQECWPANTGDGDQYYLNDLYSRWVVEEVISTPSTLVRNYKDERRSALERFFVGKTRNTTIVVKIHMRDPDVDFTLPLLLVDYSGKRGEGQVFTTSLSRSDTALPDFRISPTTSANIEANARSSTEIDVHATGIVLGTLRDALSVASPGSSLLTSINREQVQRTATAYDTALSRLLSSTVAETMTSGRMLSEWRPGDSILVSVALPRSVRTVADRDEAGDAQRRITFRLGMTCPRISAFDTLNVCEMTEGLDVPVMVSSTFPSSAEPIPADSRGAWPGWDSSRYALAVGKLRGRLSPQQVLSFRLGQGKTLRQFLTEQEWFLSLSKTIVTVPSEVNLAAASAAEKRPGADEGSESSPPAPVGAEAPTAGNGPAASSDNQLKDSTTSANELCQAITEKLYSAGLSRLDASIGLWATITGMSDFANARGVFQNAPACRENMPTGPAKGRWRFEQAPVPDDAPSKNRRTTRGRSR